MTSIKFYPATIALAPDANTDPYHNGHHKGWDYLDNLKVANGTAYCRHESYQSPYTTSSNSDPNYEEYMIASVNGTLNTPAPLVFSFNFDNLPTGEEVAKIIVHYKQQTFLNNNEMIDLSGATCSNTYSTETNTGSKVTTSLKEVTHTFLNINKAALSNNSFRIKLAYPKNQAESTGQLILKDFYVEVITAQSITKYPQNNRITSGVTCGKDDNYKCWDYLDNLKTSNGIAYCRHESYATTDNPDRHYIAGRNGTYKQPAPIDLTNFGFDFGSDIVIEKVEICYKQQKFINNGYYPEIGNPKLTILNTNKPTITGQREVTSSLTQSKTILTGFTPSQISNNNFGVRLAYPANTATTPGRIILQDFYIKVYYNDNGTKLAINGNFNPSSRTVGNPTTATFTVKKTSNAAYTSNTIIDLPLGVEVDGSLPGVSKTNLTKNGYKYQRLTWNHTLPTGTNVSNSLTVPLVTKYPTKDLDIENANRCIITDSKTNISYSCYFTVYDINVELSTTFYADKKALRAEYENKSSVTVKSNDPQKRMKVLHIRFGTGDEALTNLDEITELGVVDSAGFTTGAYWIKLVDNGSLNVNIPLKVWYDFGGEYAFHMWVSYTDGVHVGNEIEKTFIVLHTDLGELSFSRVEIIPAWTNAMGDGLYYTLGTLVKLTLKNNNHSIADYGDNYRVGVFNSSEEYVSDKDSFLDKVIWTPNIATTSAKEVLVKFKYNKNNPLYIVYSHGYVGDPVSKLVTFNFTEHLLVETNIWGTVNNIGHSLWPIPALLIDHKTTYATATFNAGIKELIPAVVYDWEDGGLFESNISILGIEVLMDYITTDDVLINCELYFDKEHKGSRDVMLRSGEGVAHIGSPYDLFGLKVADIINNDKHKVNPFEIRITVHNSYLNKAKIQLNNVRLGIEYINRTKCGYGFSIDGERGEDYGIMLNEVTHHRGTNNTKSLYQVEGTDNTVINRINIDTKEITLKIILFNCTIKAGRYQIDKVVELFTNNRELHSNKPILKKLVFDHLDDRYYEFARIDEFDDEFRGGNYYATIKLLVPDGTTYDLEETVSGPHGYSPSTVTSRPVIKYISSKASSCRIYETELGQELIISTNLIKNGSILTIDNEHRKVYLNDTVDITGYVDFNSSWFRLRGEYSFESDTGNIIEVAYRVRRG